MRLKPLTVALLFLLPGFASAGFTDDRDPKSSIQRSSSHVSITGFAAVKKEVVGGMGREMPLKNALEQITPKTYTLVFKGMWDEKVSWHGGVDWTDVLSSIATKAGVSVIIDTDKQTVLVQKTNSNDSDEPAREDAATTWTVKSGATLRETFSNWAAQSGWQLAWESQELVASADVTVEGKFDTAVEMVVDALNRGGAGIRAVFYEANRVLRITEKK